MPAQLSQRVFQLPGFPLVYNFFSFPFLEISTRLMWEAIKDRVSGTALDLGTGTGSVALSLEKLGFQVTGIDQSEMMLQSARLKAKSSNFIQGNVLELPAEVVKDYDLITAFYILRFISLDDTNKFFSQVERVSKPGTILVVTDFTLPIVIPGDTIQLPGPAVVRPSSMIIETARQSGFTLIETKDPPLSFLLVMEKE